MKICYTADFWDYGIRQKGKTFSSTMSEYLWFKMYEYHRQSNFKQLQFEEVLAYIHNENYYLASLVASYKGKQIIQHGEIYEVTSEYLREFVLKMNSDNSNAWGMFAPVFELNAPIKTMISFNENWYFLEIL